MKKFRIAALLMCFVAFSFAMTSCQKTEDLIIGKWKLTKVEGSSAAYSNDGIGGIWEFKADNTFSITGTYEGISVTTNGTYTIEDDVLNITMQSVMGGSRTTKSTIKSISKSTMVLADPDDANNTATFEKQ